MIPSLAHASYKETRKAGAGVLKTKKRSDITAMFRLLRGIMRTVKRETVCIG